MVRTLVAVISDAAVVRWGILKDATAREDTPRPCVRVSRRGPSAPPQSDSR
jgi:hypothetical protein